MFSGGGGLDLGFASGFEFEVILDAAVRRLNTAAKGKQPNTIPSKYLSKPFLMNC